MNTLHKFAVLTLSAVLTVCLLAGCGASASSTASSAASSVASSVAASEVASSAASKAQATGSSPLPLRTAACPAYC